MSPALSFENAQLCPTWNFVWQHVHLTVQCARADLKIHTTCCSYWEGWIQQPRLYVKEIEGSRSPRPRSTASSTIHTCRGTWQHHQRPAILLYLGMTRTHTHFSRTRIHTHIHAQKLAHIYIYIHTTCTQTHTHKHVHMGCTHTQIYTHTQFLLYTHKHNCTPALRVRVKDNARMHAITCALFWYL